MSGRDAFTCRGAPESAISTSAEGCCARPFVSARSISGARSAGSMKDSAILVVCALLLMILGGLHA